MSTKLQQLVETAHLKSDDVITIHQIYDTFGGKELLKALAALVHVADYSRESAETLASVTTFGVRATMFAHPHSYDIKIMLTIPGLWPSTCRTNYVELVSYAAGDIK